MLNNNSNSDRKKFTDDIYSTSELYKNSLEGVKSETTSFANVDENMQVEFVPDLPSKSAKTESVHTALNGISWKKRRKKVRREITTLNNGEPLSFAIRKIVKEFIIIFSCIAILVVFFLVKGFVVDKLSDNSYASMSASSRYAKTVKVPEMKFTAKTEFDGYFCLQGISTWAGKVIDPDAMIKANGGKDITKLADGMERELQKVVSTKVVSKKQNISNYDLLTGIYESLKAETPVIVACVNVDGSDMTYAVISAMNTVKQQVTITRPNKKNQKLSFDDFIELTRFKKYDKQPLTVKLGFAIGLYNKNTVFFFNDEAIAEESAVVTPTKNPAKK